MATQTQAQLNPLMGKVTTRPIVWGNLVQRSWGDEFKAPDRGIYEFNGGRRFDSTDTGNTGIYAGGAGGNSELQSTALGYPDMPDGGLLTGGGDTLTRG